MDNTISLKEIREKTNMTRTDFAAAFGIEEAEYSEMEETATPKPYLVTMINELCIYRGYYIIEDEKGGEKMSKVAEMIEKMANLTNNEFAEAFYADDYARCREMIDMQRDLRRITTEDATQFVNILDQIEI